MAKNMKLSLAMRGNRNAAGPRSGRKHRQALAIRSRLTRDEIIAAIQSRRLPIDDEIAAIHAKSAEFWERRNRVAAESYLTQAKLAGRKIKRRLLGT